MSSRQLHSKGASDGQSLPERTRKTKTSTDQPDQQTMDQQSSSQPERHSRPGSAQQLAGETATPATNPTRRADSTPLHIAGLPQMQAVQVGLLSRTGSPQVQLPATRTSSSHISPMSGPLFTEDRLNTSGSDQEMCDQEVTTLTQDRTPTRSPVHNAPSRTGSIATVDYSTQGDLDQPARSPMGSSGNQSNSIDNTRNFLLPDGTGRRILDIPISERKPFILDNGHSVYQIQLENLEPVLETSTYLIDRLTGQFHAVSNDGYHQMATTPMIWSTWRGQLVAELNETRMCFGLPPTNTLVKKPAVHQQVPAVVIQRSQSHFQQMALEDVVVPELTNQTPLPRTVEYLEPSFSLERPVHRLEMDERLEVHNNFISAISNKMHKVDLM